jgi:hypothetical protein
LLSAWGVAAAEALALEEDFLRSNLSVRLL